ncbi:MAG: hypothetical protein KC731_04750 [Myxococcales bacterium]|nr:hypothetical protein [Myxococcales bacterium]
MTSGATATPHAPSAAPLERTPVPWMDLLVLLCLELTRPLHVEAGLPLVPEQVTRGARLALKRIDEDAADPSKIPFDVGDYLVAAIGEAAGEGADEIFERWANHTVMFHHAQLPQWGGWAYVFEKASTEGDCDLGIPASHASTMLSSYRAYSDVTDIDGKIAALSQLPYSDGDVLLMALHGLDPDYRPASPFTQLRLVAHNHRVQQFASYWGSRLDAETQRAMTRAAAAIIEADGLWLPVPLQSFATLPRGPAC